MARSSSASRRVAAAMALFAVLFAPVTASATWSIIIVDPTTKEIGIGAATCLVFFNLKRALPVLLVGKGGACAQAMVDGGATNRQVIFAEIQNGTDPADILTMLSVTDPDHEDRQYGMVDTLGRSLSFSGANTLAFAGGVTGTTSGLDYAVQGNILTGSPVVSMAEAAIIGTSGDIAERLMVSMEAARTMGGDGRCSCTPAAPTSCGSPPASFTKSAHCGFMIIARLGDTDGNCTNNGCATGDYYLNLNIANQSAGNLDPVIQLRSQFDDWRAALVGRPDHVKSTAAFTPPALPANGAVSALLISARDYLDAPILAGGAAVSVTIEPGSANATTVGSVTDNGDGTYTVPITATLTTGVDTYRIVINDGIRPVTLTPFASLTVVVPGDFTGDGMVNGDDINGFVAAATGADLDPLHRAASDINANSVYGDDASAFANLLLGL